MITHQTKFKGIVINVKGTHYKGDVWSLDMSDSQEFEIEEITANGLDLTEVFEDDMNEIENLIIETHYS